MRFKTIFKLSVVSCACTVGYFIYQDAKNSKAFRCLFTQSYLPVITTTLAGNDENFLVDTGGAFFCRFDQRRVDSLPNYELHRELTLKKCDGALEECKEYALNDFKLFGIKFEKLFFLITHNESMAQGNLSGSYDQLKKDDTFQAVSTPASFLGHRLLDDLNFFIDCSSRQFIFYKAGYIPLTRYPFKYLFLAKKIPFNYSPSIGLCCEIKTSYGVLKFLIDTGSPVSLLKNSKAYTVPSDHGSANDMHKVLFESFSLGDEDWGPFHGYVQSSLDFEGIDGILGMDFFHDKKAFFNMSQYYFSLSRSWQSSRS